LADGAAPRARSGPSGVLIARWATAAVIATSWRAM
jgi:hypothetical protein